MPYIAHSHRARVTRATPDVARHLRSHSEFRHQCRFACVGEQPAAFVIAQCLGLHPRGGGNWLVRNPVNADPRRSQHPPAPPARRELRPGYRGFLCASRARRWWLEGEGERRAVPGLTGGQLSGGRLGAGVQQRFQSRARRAIGALHGLGEERSNSATRTGCSVVGRLHESGTESSEGTSASHDAHGKPVLGYSMQPNQRILRHKTLAPSRRPARSAAHA